jgi:AcrR family transcriptional regulator
MVDPKVNRKKTIQEAKTNLILDAALKVFSQQGFHDTRLEDIAAAAGFSKASLYNYYEDKEAIFLSLTIREYQRLIDTLKQIVAAQDSFEGKLRKILESTFEIFGEHFAIILTISHFRTANILTLERLNNQHSERTEIFKNLYEEISNTFISIIQSAKQSGEIACRIEDTVLAQYIGALIRGVCMEWKIAGEIGDTRKVIDQLILFIKKGMNSN